VYVCIYINVFLHKCEDDSINNYSFKNRTPRCLSSSVIASFNSPGTSLPSRYVLSSRLAVCVCVCVCVYSWWVLYELFLKADMKGPLIQTDRGINTIPNLIDPSQKIIQLYLNAELRGSGTNGDRLSVVTGREGRHSKTTRDNGVPALIPHPATHKHGRPTPNGGGELAYSTVSTGEECKVAVIRG